MSAPTPQQPLSLGAVFVVCCLIGTVVLTLFVDWSIWVELRPGYRMIKDEASWPTRVLFGCLFAVIQSGVIVALLALWRRRTHSHSTRRPIRHGIKLFMAIFFILGGCLVARAEYQTHLWVAGSWPHRIGLVGIREGSEVYTQVCLGDEIQGVTFLLPLHIYIVTALACVPPIAVAALYRFRRHAKAT